MATLYYRGHKMTRWPALNIRNEYALLRHEMIRPEAWEAAQRDATTRTKFEYAITATYHRCFLGAEAFVCFAVFATGLVVECGLDAKSLHDKIINPMASFPGKGTAGAFYDALPSLLSPDIALSVADPALHSEIRTLYKELRNPLFHGYQVVECTRTDMVGVFEHFDALYAWMDGWYVPPVVERDRPDPT